MVSTATLRPVNALTFPEQTYTNFWLDLPPTSRSAPETETARPIPVGIALQKSPRYARPGY